MQLVVKYIMIYIYYGMDDLLVQERSVTREFFSAIKASKSTNHLSLDQILVSCGP